MVYLIKNCFYAFLTLLVLFTIGCDFGGGYGSDSGCSKLFQPSEDECATACTTYLACQNESMINEPPIPKEYQQCLDRCNAGEFIDQKCTNCLVECWLYYADCPSAQSCTETCMASECNGEQSDDDTYNDDDEDPGC